MVLLEYQTGQNETERRLMVRHTPVQYNTPLTHSHSNRTGLSVIVIGSLLELKKLSLPEGCPSHHAWYSQPTEVNLAAR